MKKAFVIIRVSAQDQLKGYGPDNQWHDDILPSAVTFGLAVTEELTRVIQESATTWERAKWESAVREAMALHSKGEIDVLLLPRVDRETRFVFGSFPLLVEVVRSGLEVCFAREKLFLDPYDSESVERYLTKATQAQAYAETLKINTTRGRKARIASGKLANGRASYLDGYDYIPGKGEGEGIRRINNVRAKVVRDIYDWFAVEWLLLDRIIYRLWDLGIPSPTGNPTWARATVYKMLSNPAYCGLAGEATPAIIDKETFFKAKARLKRNKELASRNVKRSYLLRGYVYCRYCGRRYQGALKQYKTKDGIKEYEYYRCSSSFRINRNPCPNRSWKAECLESIVWQKIEAALSNPKVILAGLEALKEDANNIDAYTEELNNIEKGLVDLRRQQEQLLQWALKGFPESTITNENVRINDACDRLNQRKVEIEAKMESAKQAEGDTDSVEQAIKAIKNNLPDLSFENKRFALEALNIRITVDENSLTIEGTLPVSQGVIVSTPSNRNGERMPSISACQPTQPGQSMPLGWGLPHLGQSGGMIRGRDRRQAEQINSPPLPQPTHHCGKRRSSALPLSLAN